MTRYRRVSRDANHAPICAALRAIGCSVLDLSAVGGGCPDVAVGYRGATVLMEFKNQETRRGQGGMLGKATAARQREWLEAWRGGPALIVRSVDEALAAVGALR